MNYSDMIRFTVEQCGPTPKTLVWSVLILIILTVLIIVSKGGNKNE